MAIPVSHIVSITPRVIQAGSAGLVFNGLIFTTNENIPTNTILNFNSADEVGTYFGYASDEYISSTTYFTGYDNSFIKPSQLKFIKRISSDIPAYLRGFSNAELTLAELQQVTAGTLSISIDGTSAVLSDVDLSSTSSFSEAALLIQTALQETSPNATVQYSSQYHAFVITSGTSGVDSSVSYATGTLADIFSMTEKSGGIISTGSASLTIAEQLAGVIQDDANWATFTSLYEMDIDEASSAISWSVTQGVEYLYIVHTDDVSATIDGNDLDILSQLKLKNLSNFAAVYGTFATAVAVMGMVASIDYSRQNGSIDLAFKSVTGIASSVTDLATAVVLDDKGYNYFGLFAARNSEYAQFYKGQIIGDYINIYTYVNAIWLNNTIQVTLMDGLRVVGKLSYNVTGYGYIKSWIDGVITTAINNGVVVAGVTLSDTQQTAITNEVGEDAIPPIQSNGYYLSVDDPGAAARQSGTSPAISLYYTDGGSVKKLELASTVLI